MIVDEFMQTGSAFTSHKTTNHIRTLHEMYKRLIVTGLFYIAIIVMVSYILHSTLEIHSLLHELRVLFP